MRLPLIALALSATVISGAAADEDSDIASNDLPSILEATDGMQRVDGFVPFYVDASQGTLLVQLPATDFEFIYATGLSSGLGSNPVGLDRGQWGATRVVRFRVVGRKGYLIAQNLKYRASATDQAERTAVRDSFADSVFWSHEIKARTGDDVLIDLQSLLLTDAHDVVGTLQASEQGDYKFEPDLSFIELPRCRAFPDNTELEATVTFTSKKPGRLVSQTAADGTSFSVRMHHSFVRLPPPGYRPREADPRVASFTMSFADYSAPLDQPLERRWIARHRLQKADPALARSPAKEPIVYYLDPGTPQPVRDALLEGARWWNAAFEAAGFVNAFQVRMLPEDVDPMDVRYNVIQWVHRRTRGWSYGQSVTDPRTGEIIKGHVLLGSLRVRQDRLLIDGLTATSPPAGQSGWCSCCGIAGGGFESALALFDPQTSPVEVSLARLRQLSAHEVGHTIGFAHNFAASAWGDRASVMDYPAPRVKIVDGQELDLSDAYGVGIGVWDTLMVRYAYTEFSDADSERAGLQELLDEIDRNKMRYLSDADARPAGAAHPLANLWDNGTEPVAELNHLLRVRQIALAKLDQQDLLQGQPLSDLEVVLVPIYLYHRYQIDAVAKLIGGFDYDYAVAGQTARPVTAIAEDRQRQAVAALLECLASTNLEIPQQLLPLLSPRPWSSASDRERFPSRTAMIFDPDAAVRVTAEQVIGQMLQPERLARVQTYSTATWDLPRLLALLEADLMTPAAGDPRPDIRRIVQHVFVQRLMELADDQSTSHAVRSASADRLLSLITILGQPAADNQQASHQQTLLQEIRRFLDRPHSAAAQPRAIAVPPGSPIGDSADRGTRSP
jgi:hypothetical protein